MFCQLIYKLLLQKIVTWNLLILVNVWDQKPTT
ncbi:hypothetical protein Cyast_2744 [Cyanobacterium stanieri PCC 7202]|uniref:Uncharacterized protein n=1 Tax=Cyanobacterium stanieri (strain ATCC 29140 / PCC 7202) TaxID=292563 RepID=K9YP31_CYASC|nr:hypothetical protein Cyast_2744 [Cyanobacterium stanieri PCC 7202]